LKPKLIRLFLAEEIPDGLRTIELSNTTVIGTIFPRASLGSFGERESSTKPGVYLLIGPDEDDPSVRRVYVGEGDPVLPRLRNHIASKEFWTQAVVFTSKDDYLTKTQIQFLESSIIEKLKNAARSIIDNGTTPTLPNTSEAERSEVEHFLEVTSLLLASIGIDILEPRSATVPIVTKDEDVYAYSVKAASARMVISPQGYVVLKGSTAVREERPSAASLISRMRQSLVEANILRGRQDNLFEFTADVPFESPSTAASMIAGGNTNGRMKWRLPDGRTLKDVEEQSAVQ
jgi:hypothetical protein